MKRSVKGNVYRRITTNRKRINEALERDEREAEAIRLLNQSEPEEKTDVVAEMCASVIRVQREG